MKLYWMRHAEAESGAQMDPTRQLTDTGKAQAKMMGKWLKRQGHQPTLLCQSSFARSQQTAKHVGKKLDLEPVTMTQLDPENEPEIAWQALRDMATKKHAKAVIAVSHGPLVEKMLAYLTGGQMSKQVHFAHAAIAHFDTTTGQRGVLHWLVTPNTVARDHDEMENVTQDLQKTTEAALRVAELALGLDQ